MWKFELYLKFLVEKFKAMFSNGMIESKQKVIRD